MLYAELGLAVLKHPRGVTGNYSFESRHPDKLKWCYLLLSGFIEVALLIVFVCVCVSVCMLN